ncbi:hypothetical protein Q9L42_007605 [Methylomarinum sp. Ch1-1]|uniref:Uncharacterized protein n=1 Tax=Methylomarinum roseum TaxID=3067653 RepID=A0AAU7NYF6_9GAMM
MIKQAIEQIRARALELSLVALGTMLLSGLLLVENHLIEYVPTVDPKVIVRSIAVLTAITAYSWAAFFYFKPRLKFDKRLQIYIDIKTEIPYCPSCKDGHKRLFKLINKDSYWQCAIKECRMVYDNPDYNPPSKPPRDPAYG